LHRHIPLYFKLFPGSITDVVTLKSLVAKYTLPNAVVALRSKHLDYRKPLHSGSRVLQ